VPAADLKEGSVYFSVSFIDKDIKIPIMGTLVFVGKREEKFVFQDAESFFQGVRYDSVREGDFATFFRCGERDINGIYEYEKALDVLTKCSLRRQSKMKG
jgi:hypothetical protein